MKLGEVVVIHVYYNYTKFHQNRMKNKKVLLMAQFSVQNFKVSVELWNLYIVRQAKPDELTKWRMKKVGYAWGFFCVEGEKSEFSSTWNIKVVEIYNIHLMLWGWIYTINKYLKKSSIRILFWICLHFLVVLDSSNNNSTQKA